ncbi:MAG: proliferating cell nuclear antigen (pcna) [Candidatus Aenigmatarchaeota archaeon]
MFRAVLSETELLRSTIPIIAEIIDEAILKFDSNGLSICAPDRTMVAVVDFRLLSSAFEEWKVDTPTEIGLNMENLATVLKRAKVGDKIVLEMSKAKFKIRFEGTSVRIFELPIIDVRLENPPVDQLKFSGKVELSSSVLEEGIADADVVSDSIFFEAENDEFRMAARGDISTTQLELKTGQPNLLSIQTKGHIRAQYALDYLKKMIKVARLCPQATLEFGQDYPMRLAFSILDKMSLSFILAPRISE